MIESNTKFEHDALHFYRGGFSDHHLVGGFPQADWRSSRAGAALLKRRTLAGSDQ